MDKDLIINVSKGSAQLALTQGGRLIEYDKESEAKAHYSVGDVYLGKVKKLLPSLNAAFVDIGDEKEAFIHYLDLGINFRAFDFFVKQINISKNYTTFFEKVAIADPLEKEGHIQDHLHVGQPVMVQIVKEPISTKGSRLTAEISIAGRNIVLLPFSDKVSISQKISSKEEKARLSRLIYSILPKNYGVIVRTAAEGKRAAILDAELKGLINKWESSWKKVARSKDVQLLFRENSRVNTLIRDLLNDDFSHIYVNDKSTFDEVCAYVAMISPGQEKIVHHYTAQQNIFDHFDITRQIKGSFGRVVSLRRGAYLVIDHTEAMHVIDVNSGIRIKTDAQEDNALEVNMIAAEEIARQLRLRDMGGIVIVDFIDMDNVEHRNQLYKYMTTLMEEDRARHTVLPLTKFGLMQITRQRVRPATEVETQEVCPACKGTGKIGPTTLIDDALERHLAEILEKEPMSRVRLVVNPVVHAYITAGGLGSIRRGWRRKYKCAVKVVKDGSFAINQSEWYDPVTSELLCSFYD